MGSTCGIPFLSCLGGRALLPRGAAGGTSRPARSAAGAGKVLPQGRCGRHVPLRVLLIWVRCYPAATRRSVLGCPLCSFEFTLEGLLLTDCL